MKQIIKYHLLTEGRLEDIKKKYPNVPPEFIDKISSKDPSGNNKYLEWMMHNIYGIMTRWGRYDTPDEIQHTLSPNEPNRYSHDFSLGVKNILRIVESFHKNVDRLTPERVYEALEKKVGHIPQNFTIIKLGEPGMYHIQKLGIWESKNINAYSPYTLGLILDYIIEHYPSKSEIDKIKKQETISIYEDDSIKIVAPQSFASSCMYGAETRWCTTSKTKGNDYFKEYTRKNMVLIYFIFKKPQNVDALYKASNSTLSMHDRVVREDNTVFKKMALQFNMNNKVIQWFDEVDNNIEGLPLLKGYIKLTSKNPEQEFKTIKDKINQYIKSKDERSPIKKLFRRGKI